MPKFVYAPEGAEPRDWDFEPNRLPSKDAELIERRTGMHFGQWLDAIDAGSMLAYHALLFVFLRRDNPGLQWDQVDFTFADVGIRLSDQEVRDRLVRLERVARDSRLSEREYLLLGALRESTSADELAEIQAQLDAEDAKASGTTEGGDEGSDPTPPATEPEPPTEPAPPAKPRKTS